MAHYITFLLTIVSKAVSKNIAVSCFVEQAPAWQSPISFQWVINTSL